MFGDVTCFLERRAIPHLEKGEGDFTVVKSTSAWSKAAHTIFLDQPFNVGLSFGDYQVQDSVQGAKYMVNFLEQFFVSRPTLAKAKFYVFRVSYAGHYVPVLGEEILKSELMKNINFQGIGVGNGWTDPETQYSSYSSFFNQIGIMSNSRVQSTKEQMLKAQKAIFEGDHLTTTIEGFYGIFDIMDKFTGKINAYHLQQYEIDSNAEDIQAGFINQYKNQFKTFRIHIQQVMNTSQSKIKSSDLQRLIRYCVQHSRFNIHLAILGVTAMINSINWDKIGQWKAAPKQIWKALNPVSQQREVAGTIKQFENLSFATVYMAGHMTPRDQPIASLEMLQHFLKDDDWS